MSDARSLAARRILIVDDHRNIRISLRMALEGAGAQIFEADCVASGISKLGHMEPERFAYDCVLLDIRMPDGSGLEILERLSQAKLASRVIMISGEGTVADAFKATQKGAFDYIEKPFGEERIIVSVERCIKFHEIETNCKRMEKQLGQSDELIGSHPKLAEVLAIVKRVAPTNGRVLITGESGTGKELVARAIHKQSQRAKKEMIKVNCAAIPASLIESELFGHEKGAFTGATKSRKGVFERANQGTLFLDEIGELPGDMQAKLLRALQNGEIQRVGSETITNVDVRLLAATNRDLQEMVEAGEFREDLFYRLNVVTVDIPPLRERPSDIKDLATSFLAEACQEHALGDREWSEEAIKTLTNYSWPGNVRELKNVVERLAILSEQPVITDVGMLADQGKTGAGESGQEDGTGAFKFSTDTTSWQEFHNAAGRSYLKFILRQAEGNVSQAARTLCLERAYLHRLMKKLGVQRDVVVSD